MQIRAEQVVVVVVVRRGVVVVLGGFVVVVVVVVVGESAVVVVVVDVVVVVVIVVDDAGWETTLVVVAVGAADRDAGGIGSTAPNSAGSRSDESSPSTPKANRVQASAPTTAPTASRPCPLLRREDSIGVLRKEPATTAS
jgi:hypothetical protein